MKTKSPIFINNDVDGTPFKIGNRVRVLDNPNQDETFNTNSSNRVGKIIYFEYNCGCGQTFPNDPMIGVKFDNVEIEEFWKEELILIL